MLEKLQNFLPQMAEANRKLKERMEEAPAGHFDIERVDEAQRVIEMVSGAPVGLNGMGYLISPSLLFCQDVALVELSGSESDFGGEEETSTSEEESASEEECSVKEKKLRLPSEKGKKQKANIQVVTQQGEP